jgi:hypothetical protein
MRRGWLVFALVLTGCGTTRQTDSKRAGSEMLLVSQAIDHAVGQIDFSPLAGKTVYFEDKFLDGGSDEGYLVSSIRQSLLSYGALLKDKKADAAYIVEARNGGLGTDRHSLLVGTPAITLPSLTAIPITSIPEIALVKKSDQRGVAKVAVYAYHRESGRALWASGVVEAGSNLKDTWVFGAGPFSRGSIRQAPELAGEPLPKIPLPVFTGTPPAETTVAPAGGTTDIIR